jgi:nitroimidazol reductase NimA-like FMN-containing flavoprotein (pyridoxamine 5'-phosphate oxidase superfamily)
MPRYDIEQWEHTQAEIAIRRWLYSIGQWAPGIEDARPAEEPEAPRLLSDDEVDQALRSEVVGRLGCHAEGKTYVVPVLYAYDGQFIYGHTNEGMKLRMLRANPLVCFEVDHSEGLANWQSVIAWGQFEELYGMKADRAEQLLVDRIKLFLADTNRRLPRAQGDVEGQPDGRMPRRAVVYRIGLTERSGRAAQS